MSNDNERPLLTDVGGDGLPELPAEVTDTLLRDHTTGRHIFWASHDYEALGPDYGYHSEILPRLITGGRRMVVRPRVHKTKEQQTDRSKNMAEVFTPSWVCNAQNNLADEAWFGRKDVFNTEADETDKVDADSSSASRESGISNPLQCQRRWKANPGRIEFPDDKSWTDYVRATRLEITCGEAPYLVSRYDATTGGVIPLQDRIGLLDRKLRVVTENTCSREEWTAWARVAYQNIYGYEWQGDNLLLARNALLYTFIEYYQAAFLTTPPMDSIKEIADIISWNLWQMDGLKGVVPDSCHDVVSKHKPVQQLDFFAVEVPQESKPKVTPCPGCSEGNIYKHNGRYCKIRDWEANKTIRFIDLIKQK